MLSESSFSVHEKGESRPDPLPSFLAQEFLDGTLSQHPAVFSNDFHAQYSCFERQESVGDIPNAWLDVEYFVSHEASLERPSQMRFEYATRPQDPSEISSLIAQMYLGIAGPRTFTLDHRLVRRGFQKRAGIGTQLFRRAEEWVQQVANLRQSSVNIVLDTGQLDVIAWAKKMGFGVREDQRKLLEEIERRPGRFVIDDVVDTDGLLKERYIFQPGVAQHTPDHAVRLMFFKRISPTIETEVQERVEIREATVADATAIAAIAKASWFATYVDEDAGITREDIAEYLESVNHDALYWEKRLRAVASARTFVSLADDRIVGFCRVWQGPNHGDVEALYLDPSFVGKGIGASLLSEGLQWLDDEKPVELDVAAYSRQAIGLYRRFGFHNEGLTASLPLLHGKQIPRLAMVRDVQEK